MPAADHRFSAKRQQKSKSCMKLDLSDYTRSGTARTSAGLPISSGQQQAVAIRVFATMSKSKIFGIGLAKTGTTSLNDAFAILGIASIGCPTDIASS